VLNDDLDRRTQYDAGLIGEIIRIDRESGVAPKPAIKRNRTRSMGTAFLALANHTSSR